MNYRLDDIIDEGALQWFKHVERMESDSIAKRIYVGECTGSRSLGRPPKRRTDTVKECLRRRCLNVRQERRMVQYMCEWWGICEGEYMERSSGMNP